MADLLMEVSKLAIGALVGFALGRLTKQIEFRFDLLKRLVDHYQRIRNAAIAYQGAIELANEHVPAGDREARERAVEAIRQAGIEMQAAVGEALSLPHLVAAAFEDGVGRWQSMVSNFLQSYMIQDNAEAAGAAMKLGIDDWHAFARIAVRKLGFWPWGSWRKKAKVILTGQWLDEVQERKEERA